MKLIQRHAVFNVHCKWRPVFIYPILLIHHFLYCSTCSLELPVEAESLPKDSSRERSSC